MSAIGPFAIPIVAVGAFAATLGWFGYQHMTRGPTAPEPVTLTTHADKAKGEPQARGDADVPKAATQASGEPGGKPPQVAVARPDSDPARPSTARSPGPSRETSPARGAGPAGAAPAQPTASPAFDVVRVEPTGETVVAGRASPGATVELLLNGVRHSRVVADPSGLFALVPDSLPPGGHELVLQVTNGDGSKVRSPQSVTVVVAANRRDSPLVTITAPGQPAVVLSRPDGGTAVASATPAPDAKADTKAATGPAKAAAGAKTSAASGAGSAATVAPAAPSSKARPAVQIASVEAEGAGKFLVSANAAPAAIVRLYLNETFIAPASAAADGRVSFAIERGMQPGAYKVRLDDVDPVSGQVRSRAEVPFEMPQQVASRVVAPAPVRPPANPEMPDGSPKAEPVPSRFAVASGPSMPGAAAKEIDVAPGRTVADLSPTVVVPEINTAIVSRGESLWAISKRTYGEGLRYTVIYGANARQIRDPDLIYPGQLFVLPVAGQERAAR